MLANFVRGNKLISNILPRWDTGSFLFDSFQTWHKPFFLLLQLLKFIKPMELNIYRLCLGGLLLNLQFLEH